jgi:PAS domain S-box-containing protein
MSDEQHAPFSKLEDSQSLAQTIVDTIREPLLVLDKDLRVVEASRSFFLTFQMNRQDVQGRPIYALGNGEWDIPELRLLLDRILPQHTVMEDYEVELVFSAIGRRTMMLNARTVFYEGQGQGLILLSIEDVTQRRTHEHRLAPSGVPCRDVPTIRRRCRSCRAVPTGYDMAHLVTYLRLLDAYENGCRLEGSRGDRPGD